MCKIIDDYLYLYLKDNDYKSLSAFDDNLFKSQIDWRSKKEIDDLFFINWGENLHGTNHSVIETGFFFDAVHLDKNGLYNFSTFNFNDTKNIIENYNPQKTAKEFLKEGKLMPKFKQPETDISWDGVVLMCQHPTDRSVLKVGTTKQYFEFIENACKFYKEKLFLKIHPVNSKETISKLENIAKTYKSEIGRVNTNIINNCEYVVIYNSTAVVDCLLRDKLILHYAPGYFWKTGTVDYSYGQFRLPKNINFEYNQKFCDFLVWKYCFHRKDTMDNWNKIFNTFKTSSESFPLPEELSYGSFINKTDKKLPHHLGGHANKTHIDEGVLSYIKHKFNIKNMIDIGCGPGGMFDVANKLNILYTGIDGDFNIKNENIIIHDFNTGSIDVDNFDLGWSVEFLEHVEEKYIDNFMKVFEKCDIVVLTHALPNKGGHHHVNCQNSEYWKDVFKKYNLYYDEDETNIIRSKSNMKRNFMKTTGMLFKRKK